MTGERRSPRSSPVELLSNQQREAPADARQARAVFRAPIDGPRWNGWGADLNSNRFQPAAMTRSRAGPGLAVASEMGVQVS